MASSSNKKLVSSNPGPRGPFESGHGEDGSPRGGVVTAMLRAIPPAMATSRGRGQRRVPRPGWRAKPTGKESAAAGQSKGTHPEGRSPRGREWPPEGSGHCGREGGGRERRPGEGGHGGARSGETACGADGGARPPISRGWWCPPTAGVRRAEVLGDTGVYF